LRRVVAVVFLVLIAGCARRLPPPGGPPDTTPPEIVASKPEHLSTQVSLDTRIEIAFSERMDHRTVESSVYLVPLSDEPPEISWSGSRLIVCPKERLRGNTTYVLTVGASARDLRGNHLTSSTSVAFSTGDRIDHGMVSGYVRDSGRPVAGAVVGLYPLPDSGDVDPDRTRPVYISESGEDGSFSVGFLTAGTYRVFAFRDGDSDLRADAGVEPVAVASADAVAPDSGEAGPFELWLVSRPEFPPALVSCDAADSTHLFVSFDQPVLSNDLTRRGSYALIGPGVPSVLAAWTPPGLESSGSARLWVSGLVAGEEYTLLVSGPTDEFGREVDTAADRAVFVASSRSDTTGPLVALAHPRGPYIPAHSVAYVEFDEPMDTSSVPPSAALADSVGPIESRLFWNTPFRLTAAPSLPLKRGQTYRFGFSLADVRDASGNAGSDTVFTHAFTVTDPSVLGELTGELHSRDSAKAVIEAFVRGATISWTAASPGIYVFSEFPQGDATIRGFLDLDGDGRWFPGNVIPFRPCEPIGMFPDTVHVRPRWTVEGADMEFR
jgi:hypothetical protein